MYSILNKRTLNQEHFSKGKFFKDYFRPSRQPFVLCLLATKKIELCREMWMWKCYLCYVVQYIIKGRNWPSFTCNLQGKCVLSNNCYTITGLINEVLIMSYRKCG